MTIIANNPNRGNNLQIAILDQAINMIDGLYSLNDLHRASGSNKKHQPAFFMRNKETKELIDELKFDYSSSANMQNKEPVRAVRGIQKDNKPQGTYVCKELVYRYAMWISPKFALLVIRTFDNLVTANSNIAPLTTTDTPSTVKDRNGLIKTVHMTMKRLDLGFSEAFNLVLHRFNVAHVGDLTQSQVCDAVEYLHRLMFTGHTASAPVQEIEPTYHYRNNERLVSQADAQGHLWTRPLADHEFVISTTSLPQFINDCDDLDLQELTALSFSVSKKMVEKQTWSNVVMVGNDGEQL